MMFWLVTQPIVPAQLERLKEKESASAFSREGRVREVGDASLACFAFCVSFRWLLWIRFSRVVKNLTS